MFCSVVMQGCPGFQLRGLGVALVGFHIPWGPATWPWCGLGVALVEFHIPWGPATWPWCGLGWISHSLGSSYVALVWPWLDFTFLGVQLRGLGVALVGYHILWGQFNLPPKRNSPFLQCLERV